MWVQTVIALAGFVWAVYNAVQIDPRWGNVITGFALFVVAINTAQGLILFNSIEGVLKHILRIEHKEK